MDQTFHRNRALWRARREEMEREYARGGGRSIYRRAVQATGRVLAPTPLFDRGLRNAADLSVVRHDLSFPDLPPGFDGYRLLHLSDLHLDKNAATTEAAIEALAGVEADLCVVTGDIRDDVRAPVEPVVAAMSRLTAAIGTPDGILAVLGNHDAAAMVEPLEALGLRVLVNETVSLARNGARLHVTGIDDVHRFYTEAARDALVSGPEGFRIALVHSPEMADVAADGGCRLYLCGHTHGGQVCWPGGRPIVRRVRRHGRYARGLWKHGGMTGYTTTGVGVTVLPIRFNCRGEIALFTLRRTRRGAG